MTAPYPGDGSGRYPDSVEEVNLLKEIVYTIRNIRGEMNVPPEMKARALIREIHDGVGEVVERHREIILFLARLEWLTCNGEMTKPPGSAAAVGSGYEVYLPLKGLIDVDRERERLCREEERLGTEMARSSSKLENPDFVNRAPAEIVHRERERLRDFEENAARVRSLLKSLDS
jgi:valyl-tRNA synthetase